MLLVKGSNMIQLLLVAVVATSVTSRQITVYDDEPRQSRDYSDYTGDKSDDTSSGFAEPIDFSPFFTSGFSSSGSNPASNFFLSASSEVQPFTLPLNGGGSAFPTELEASATTNNGTGFTSPVVRFPSLFDVSGTENQAGFRAQDFIKRANQQEDGNTEESAPADFFSPSFASSGDAPFSYTPNPELDDSDDVKPTEYSPRSKPTESYRPPKKNSGKYDSPSGKSSYPSPSYRSNSNSGTPRSLASGFKYTPTSSPTNFRSVETYPSKSSSTYNPTGPYLSKSSYKSPPAGKPQYRVNADEDYESKSGYPKKVTQFHPTKIGVRPSRHQAAASETQEDTSSFSGSPYISSRAAYDEDYLPPTSNPYEPSEYGKDDEYYRAEPAEPEETTVETKQDGKNCRKVEKKLSKEAIKGGEFEGDAMTCYVCDDPKTGGSFEKCSYESDPTAKSQAYFHGHAKTYSSDKGSKPTSYRYRRGLRNFPAYDSHFADFDSHYTYSEPLVRIARQDNPSYGSKYGTSYEDYIAKFASPSENKYRYQPESYSSVEDDADFKASPTNQADNKDCKTVVKGTMTCTVCQNPKTGGSSEQCAYATNPDDNKYFVARQSSYNSGNKKPYTRTTNERSSRPKPKSSEEDSSDEQEEPSSRVPYEYSTESSAVVTRRGSQKGPIDLSSYPYASDRRSDETQVQPRTSFDSGKNYDDYFRELFPELSGSRNNGQESKNVERSQEEYNTPRRDYNNRRDDVEEIPRKNKQRPTPNYNGKPVADYKEYAQESYVQAPTNQNEQRNPRNDQSEENAEYYKSSLPDYFANTEPKKDLERVLGEFSQKDRSDCKKVIRDKMTCYQCVDKQGMQHEECMFVAASEPKSQHLAYHEVKEFRLVPDAKTSPSNISDSISLPSLDLTKTASPLAKSETQKRVNVKKANSATESPVEEVVKRIITRRRSTTTSTTAAPRASRGRRSKIDVEAAASERVKKQAEEEEEEEEEVAPREFVVDRDGLYTAETKVAYDPVMKVSLPKYMLAKSEHEAIFDEVLASGK